MDGHEDSVQHLLQHRLRKNILKIMTGLPMQSRHFGASCRIRTNDPEITNHVLWPTELKRRVSELSVSRRYNQVPLLCSHPGGFRGSWPYRTRSCFAPDLLESGCKGNTFFEKKQMFCKKFCFLLTYSYLCTRFRAISSFKLYG